VTIAIHGELEVLDESAGAALMIALSEKAARAHWGMYKRVSVEDLGPWDGRFPDNERTKARRAREKSLYGTEECAHMKPGLHLYRVTWPPQGCVLY
jgi:hypothetical protein